MKHSSCRATGLWPEGCVGRPARTAPIPNPQKQHLVGGVRAAFLCLPCSRCESLRTREQIVTESRSVWGWKDAQIIYQGYLKSSACLHQFCKLQRHQKIITLSHCAGQNLPALFFCSHCSCDVSHHRHRYSPAPKAQSTGQKRIRWHL